MFDAARELVDQQHLPSQGETGDCQFCAEPKVAAGRKCPVERGADVVDQRRIVRHPLGTRHPVPGAHRLGERRSEPAGVPALDQAALASFRELGSGVDACRVEQSPPLEVVSARWRHERFGDQVQQRFLHLRSRHTVVRHDLDHRVFCEAVAKDREPLQHPLLRR